MSVDAGQHLGLIHHVIKQMGITGSEAEEAYSESLVTIVVAAKEYDPSRNVPLANWLAKNIRWRIQNMRAAQHPTVPLEVITGIHKQTNPHFRSAQNAVIEPSREGMLGVMEYKEVLTRIDELLTTEERQVILAGAVGFKGIEIAKALKISPVQVSRIKTRALEKLKEIR